MECPVFNKSIFILVFLKFIESSDIILGQILKHEAEDLSKNICIIIGTVSYFFIISDIIDSTHIA